MSHVTCHNYFLFEKEVKLAGGGFVINGSTPFSFLMIIKICLFQLDLTCPKLAFYGSKNLCTRTDTVFFPLCKILIILS